MPPTPMTIIAIRDANARFSNRPNLPAARGGSGAPPSACASTADSACLLIKPIDDTGDARRITDNVPHAAAEALSVPAAQNFRKTPRAYTRKGARVSTDVELAAMSGNARLPAAYGLAL